jgi:tetratricopeptide (TPR) repeat protein
MKDSSIAPKLLLFLQDSDSDVRIATINTIRQIGTRNELFFLQQIAEAKDCGAHIHDRIEWAAQSIRLRHPLTSVQKVIFCQDLPSQEHPKRSETFFLTNTPVIHCVVKLVRPIFGTKVSCTVMTQNQIPMQQVKHLSFPLILDSSHDRGQHTRHWIQQLIAEDDEAFWVMQEQDDKKEDIAQIEIAFSFTPTRGIWTSGIYTVEISINEEKQYKQAFKVVSREGKLAAPVHHQKGLLFHKFKRYQDALVSYEQALKFDSQQSSSWNCKGDASIIRNLLQEASDSYAHAIRLDANAIIAHFCSDGLLHLLELNHYSTIIASLAQALLCVLDPTMSAGPGRVCIQFFEAVESGLFEGRERMRLQLEETLLLVPETVADHFAMAVTLFTMGQNDEMLQIIDQFLLLSPNSTLASIVTAISHVLVKQAEEPISLLDMAIVRSPHILALKVTKVIVYLLLDRQEDALSFLEQVQQSEPGILLLYLFKGFLLIRLHRMDQLIPLSENILQAGFDPMIVMLFNAIAFLLCKNEEGIILIEQLTETYPNFILAHLLGMFTYKQYGRTQEAIVLGKQIIEQLPNFAFAYFLQGENYLSLKQEEEAITAYQQAMQLGLDTVPGYTHKGKVLKPFLSNEQVLRVLERIKQIETK